MKSTINEPEAQPCCGPDIRRVYEISADSKTMRCTDCGKTYTRESVQAGAQPQVVGTIDFSCRVCGIQCAIAPDPPERAVCPVHCEDHNYVYSREDRGIFCEYCWQEAPHDYYLED